MAVPVYISTNSVGGFPFFHTLSICFKKFKKYDNDVKYLKSDLGGFPGSAVVENLPANAGDTGSSPGLGRSHMLQSN